MSLVLYIHTVLRRRFYLHVYIYASIYQSIYECTYVYAYMCMNTDSLSATTFFRTHINIHFGLLLPCTMHTFISNPPPAPPRFSPVWHVSPAQRLGTLHSLRFGVLLWATRLRSGSRARTRGVMPTLRLPSRLRDCGSLTFP